MHIKANTIYKATHNNYPKDTYIISSTADFEFSSGNHASSLVTMNENKLPAGQHILPFA